MKSVVCRSTGIDCFSRRTSKPWTRSSCDDLLGRVFSNVRRLVLDTPEEPNRPNERSIDELQSVFRSSSSSVRVERRSVVVHHPADVEMDFQLFYHRPEEKFHRSSFDVSMSFARLSLHLNSKQFSDLLDFFKFQNYSTLYGSSLSLSSLRLVIVSLSLSPCRTMSSLPRFVLERTASI